MDRLRKLKEKFDNLTSPERKYEGDIFESYHSIQIGKRYYLEEEIETLFNPVENGTSTYHVALFKKVFQTLYPITRTRYGLPKRPRNDGDAETLINGLTNRKTVFGREIIKERETKGDSINLREEVGHIQDIIEIINHLNDTTVTFPYDKLQLYIDNPDIAKSDDFDEEINKLKIKEKENTRIRNLLRQFAKLYLQDPYKSEFEIYDPGLSKGKFKKYLKRIDGNKSIPGPSLGNLIRFLQGNKELIKQMGDKDYQETINWLDQLIEKMDGIDITEVNDEELSQVIELLQTIAEENNEGDEAEDDEAEDDEQPDQQQPVPDQQEGGVGKDTSINSIISNLLKKKRDTIDDKVNEIITLIDKNKSEKRKLTNTLKSKKSLFENLQSDIKNLKSEIKREKDTSKSLSDTLKKAKANTIVGILEYIKDDKPLDNTLNDRSKRYLEVLKDELWSEDNYDKKLKDELWSEDNNDEKPNYSDIVGNKYFKGPIQTSRISNDNNNDTSYTTNPMVGQLIKRVITRQRGGDLHTISMNIANDRFNDNFLEETNPFYGIIENFNKATKMNILETANEEIMMSRFLDKFLKEYFQSDEMKEFYYQSLTILNKKSCETISNLCFRLLDVCHSILEVDKDIDVVRLDNITLNADVDELEAKIKEHSYDFFEHAKKQFPDKKEISIGFFKDHVYFYMETNKFDKMYSIDEKHELHIQNYDFNEEIYYINNHLLFLFYIICAKLHTNDKYDALDTYVRKAKRSKTKRLSTLLKERKANKLDD